MRLRLNMPYKAVAFIFSVSLAFSTQAGSLTESYKKAKDYDATLKAAKAQLTINQQAANQGKSSLMPQLGLGYSYENTHNDLDTDNLGNRSKNNTLNRGYGLNIKQTLFDLKHWYVYKQSLSSAKAAEADYLLSQSNLILRVSQAYFDVLRAQAQLENDRTQERALQEQLRSTTLYYDNGLLSITDLHEAEAAFDLIKVQLLGTENSVAIAQQNLSAITGEINPEPWGLSAAFEKFPTPYYAGNIEQWKSKSLENNWQIISLQHVVDAAYNKLRAQAKNRFPKITGQLGWREFNNNINNRTYGTEQDSVGNQRSVSFNIDVPLYAGGFNIAEQKKAEAELELQKQNLVQLERNLTQNVNQTFLNKHALERQIAARKTFIRSAETSLKTTRFGYDNGTRNLNDVLQAQNTLFNAKRNFENARYDYILATIQLKYLSGTLNIEDVETINQWLIPNINYSKTAKPPKQTKQKFIGNKTTGMPAQEASQPINADSTLKLTDTPVKAEYIYIGFDKTNKQTEQSIENIE